MCFFYLYENMCSNTSFERGFLFILFQLFTSIVILKVGQL